MFYFPSKREQLIFETCCLSLPPKLLDFLIEQGLNVIILPDDEWRAREICYKLLRVVEYLFPVLNKFPHQHPNYDAFRKTIFIPQAFLESDEHNIVLHELGHALDHLYYGEGYRISDQPMVIEALRKVPPLDNHCLVQDERSRSNCEQFASSFEAFFNENKFLGGKKEKKSEFYHTVNDLDQSFVDIVQRNFVIPFQDRNNVE